MRQLYTEENDKWLVENHNPDELIKNLTVRYNEYFGEERTVKSIKDHIQMLGLKQERRNWTEEQRQWLIKNVPKMSVKEMCTEFNKHFGTHRSETVIKAYCSSVLRILRLKPRNNSFGSPAGTEVEHHGIVWIKQRVKPKESSGFYRKWVPKHYYLWEQEHGKLPKNHRVIFLDGDRSNFSLDNLCAINMQIYWQMWDRKWFSDNPALTLAAIKWCELYFINKKLKEELESDEEEEKLIDYEKLDGE